ncbi:protein kinase domain-containing protein [Sorangium sp. So ce385]|uniref:serine/threonine-protein kinase n=1 Tax=Sorangium sp. So ce385 TaxID=3133308 RepID=UPI003F5BF979
MRQGEVLAGRFTLDRLVGSGGMGEVYCGFDRATGESVAVKVLRASPTSGIKRFMREAEVLAELSHPSIVRYVDHGTAASGEPYLAMEWLSGEDLAERLQRAPLSVDEAVTLVARAAEALSVVHARGIVHRDLKPSNLYLVKQDVGQVKLLDFGIAWLMEGARMTQTGKLVGTPGYMAPEQARCDGPLDARADVFALGCVLYECLSGKPAFAGANFVAILGKILFDKVPQLSESRPEAPAALQALCAAMLAKLPEERPRDGAQVAAALAQLTTPAALQAPPGAANSHPTRAYPAVLTQRERRVLSVLVMAPSPAEVATADSSTRTATIPRHMLETVEERGGQIEFLADGSIMVTILGTGVATDQAARAARSALALRAEFPDRQMAIATGRSEVIERTPTSALIDRAAQMLEDLKHVPRSAAAEGRAMPIAIDRVTAGLLDARFEVAKTDDGLWLCGEQPVGAEARRVLGKTPPFVGRDTELGTLMALLLECVEEPKAGAVLVTAPAGMGKTRLAHEFLCRVQQRDDPTTIWIGRGDPLRFGAALGLLGQALVGALGLKNDEPIEARRDRLLASVTQHVDPAEARRVAEFIGEIVGTPFPEEESVALSAARKDAQLMGDQMRRAWVDFLGSHCAAAPVLLVLEDLHWGDVATVRFVDEALRRLKDKPWMVLALARPEVHERLPGRWAERNLQTIHLRELSPKASKRMVRLVLGEGATDEDVERLVTHADGNAFHLEELIRAFAGGQRETLPETVLSMLQSRLETLSLEMRRVLRAASVFGQTFWRGAVEALLGGSDGVPTLDGHIEQLEQLEWIHASSGSTFQGERALHFRHGLVREAAYGMLTDEDRTLGHLLAGAWLERVSEPSAAVIAEHFERGGDLARAARNYERAAAQALAANDFAAVLSWTERAMSLGKHGAARGELALLRAEALRWRGELAEAARWGWEALQGLPTGSSSWYAAVGGAALAVGRLGQHERLDALAALLVSAWPEAEATGPAVVATVCTAYRLFLAGLYDRAEELYGWIDVVAARFSTDPAVSAQVLRVRSVRERIVGNIDQSRILVMAALRRFEQAHDLRYVCLARISLGYTECLLGAYAEATALLRTSLAEAERMALDHVVAQVRQCLGMSLEGMGAREEALKALEQALSAFVVQGDTRLEGNTRVYLARVLRHAGEPAEAEAQARRAVAVLAGAMPPRAMAKAALAEVLLTRGQAAEALAEAREARELLASLGKLEEGEAMIHLAYAEALEATGDHAAARVTITEARERLVATAERIEDLSRRETFIKNVADNVRTLALARMWLGDQAAAYPGARRMDEVRS